MLSPGSRVEAEIALEPTDFVVHEHRLRDVCLLPGSAFFDVIWRLLHARDLDPTRAVLTDVLFSEPVTTAPGIGREIRVVVAADDTGAVHVRATSRPVGAQVPDAGWEENLRAELSWTDDELPPLATGIAAVIGNSDHADNAGNAGNMDAVYGRARAQDVHHGPRMSCVGTVRRGAHGLLADIDLDAGDATQDFHLHPARLDAATLLGFCQVPPLADPFVPMFVSRFRAVRPLRGPALVHVPTAERLTESGELLTNDVRVYGRGGEPIAEIVGFASKRLRPGAQVSAPAAPSDRTPPTAPRIRPQDISRTAPVNGGLRDRVRALIAEHLGRPAAEVPTAVGFYELGLNSVDVLRITEQLEQLVGSTLYPTLLFEHTTVDSVVTFLATQHSDAPGSTGPATEPDGVDPEAARTEAAAPREAAPRETASREAASHEAAPPGTVSQDTACHHPAAGTVADGSAIPAETLPTGELSAFTPVWTAAGPPARGGDEGDIVVFGATFAEALRAARPGRRIVPVVHDGPVPLGGYRVDRYDRTALTDLLHRMTADGIAPAVYIDALWPAPAPYARLWALACAIVDSRRPGPHSLLVAHGPEADAEHHALGALLRTISAELPALRCRMLTLPAGPPDPVAVLAEAEDPRSEPEVRLKAGERLVRRHRSVPLPPADDSLLRTGGSYLIAGAGRIGLHIADWLVRHHRADLTLTGRRTEPPEVIRCLAEWRRLGVRARYVAADLSLPADVTRLTDAVRREHGRLNGVFHCAGVVDDAVFFRKRPEQSAAVLSAKIDAVTLLDRATADDDLDLFVAFSSLAATLPSPGQCDYAYANAALPELLRRRTGPGVGLALEWPFWADGGMSAPPASVRYDRESHGLEPMPTTAGIEALRSALAHARTSGESHLLIGYGAPDRLRTALRPAPDAEQPCAAAPGAEPDAGAHCDPDAIAVVGVAGRYPQADDLDAFWRNLRAGRDAITEVPPERWPHEELFDPQPGTPGRTYGKWGGFLDGIDRFDRAFFGISRREAERMDPQERLFLTTAWQTLEDAGYRPDRLADRRLGVFVGVMSSHFQLVEGAPDDTLPLALHSSVANRVSYRMDLRGPSMAVDTACSSSLTAIHLAVQSIRAGECTWALAGGVNLMPHPQKYLQLAAGQWLSNDGRCRSFGAGGSGYVPGEGVGALLLKPLARALADGDHIHGVIRGSCLNHGGRASGFTVPSPGAQTEVVAGAMAAAGIAPDTVTYIEAHGTGTSLGDPIEVRGLREAYAGVETTCALGSVKSVIGHLESAAGVAAVTKVLLQMRHRTLVPTLHCDEPNPALSIDDGPFRLQRTVEPWEPGSAGVLRAGVSSFGAGGSNAHLVLEEAPPPAAVPAVEGPTVVVLSAEDEGQLARLAAELLALLDRGGDVARCEVARLLGVQPDDVPTTVPLNELGLGRVDLDLLATAVGLRTDGLAHRTLDELAPGGRPELLADIAYTLQVGRAPREHRLAVVCADVDAARRALGAYLDRQAPPPGAHWGRTTEPTEYGDLVEAARERRWEHLAAAWAAGADVPWDLCHPQGGRRVSLPPYPFRGERCWPGLWHETNNTTDTTTLTKEVLVPALSPDPVAEMDRPACEVRRLPDGILLITLGRHTFTDELLAGFHDALTSATEDDSVSCVVITGSGEVFSMGATPEAMAQLAAKEGTFAQVSFLHELILRCDKPVISAIQGHARGGGLVFGLYADVVVMAQEASYGAPFLTYGFTPGAGSTFFLERKLGTAVAEQLFYTGGTLTGAELRERGASVDIRPRVEVLDAALGHAQSVTRQSRTATAELKRELAGRTLTALADVIERELHMHDRVLGGEAVERVQSRLIRDATPAAETPAPVPPPVPSPPPPVPPATMPSSVAPVRPLPPPPAGPTGEELRDAVVEVVAGQLYLKPHEVDLRQTFSDMGLDSIGAVEVTNLLGTRFGVPLESVLVYDRPTVPELADAVAAAVRHKHRVAEAATATAPALEASDPPPGPAEVSVALPGSGLLSVPSAASGVRPDTSPDQAAAQSPGVPPLVLRGATTREKGSGTTPLTLTTPAPLLAAPELHQPAMPIEHTEPAANRASAPETAHNPKSASNANDANTHAIAVIGMSGQFPDAPTLDDFWRNLAAGTQHTEEVRPDRWDVDASYDPSGRPGTTVSKWASSLSDIDRFDAPFFRVSPLEAEDMDPEQRLFLTESWRALEDAGYAVGPDEALACGVFVGCTQSDYRRIRHDAGRHDTAHSFLGGAPSVLAARISYFLNLTGPTAAVDSACSSSLLAVHLACQSILGGDCDLAVAGGVALMLGPDIHVQTSAAGILSPTGRSAPFDATADGIVLGEGVGAVVLKPLAKALADGDHIHGVIRASGTNGDGRSNGIAAPNGRAQTDLLTRVWARAGITPGQIGLVEAHGTGTPLGDPIEAKALTEAFARGGAGSASCAIGSVKGNIGHTTMAAGVASFLKVLLALKHRELPPTAGFSAPNPRLDLDASPFHVVTEAAPWPVGPDGSRIATVSSFGVSGTNCHLVVSEAPDRPRHIDARAFVVPVSARTPEDLNTHLDALADAVGTGERQLADVAYTLCAGRRHHQVRTAVVAHSVDDLAARLRAVRADTGPSLAGATPAQLHLVEEYTAGARPDFSAQFHGVEPRRTPLPPHPLRGVRHWSEPTTGRGSAPAVTWWIGPDVWQVADHRVAGTPVLPGTGALALVAAAAGDEGPLEFTGVRWLRPLHADDTKEVRVERNGPRFTLHCAEEEIATGTVRPTGEVPVPLPVDEISRRCPDHRSGTDLYARFASAGLHYGPAFRVVGEVWVGDGEALGKLTTTERPAGTWSALVDVTALDGAIQVASVLAGEGELLLPFAAARIVVRPGAQAPTWAHVSRSHTGITVRLADADGREYARIEGLVARPARAAAQQEPELSVLTPHWTPVDGERATPTAPGRTVVLYAVGAEPLAHDLASRCAGEVLPLAGGPGRLTAGDVDTVFLVATGTTVNDADTDTAVAGVFDCVRALARGPLARRRVNLTAVLDTVVPAVDGDVVCPARAAVLGILRAAGAEHPHWQVSGLDIGDAGVEPVLSAPAGHPLLARRHGQWLTRAFQPFAPFGAEQLPTPWRDRGVYLVPGGAGGIGFALSLHLARHTSADLVWLGRRPADATVTARLAAVEAAGGRARYVRGDVAEPGDVKAALTVARTEFGPVTCVIHAAMELRDRALAFADADDLSIALRPKARGVRVLHEAVRNERLDHFVLFSSAASFIDSPGQAAYAAASAAEDALGQALHTAGPFPVTVVNWGYWGTVGAVADPERARAMADAGVGSIEPTDGFAALGRLLAARVPQALVSRAAPEALHRLGVTMTDSVDDALEALAGALLVAELAAAEVLPRPGERRSVDAMADRLGVTPTHRRLFDALPPILERAGAVRRDEDHLIGLARPVDAPNRVVPPEQESLLRRCVQALPEVLAGRRNPLEVLFPGGSTAMVARFYGGGTAERATATDLADRLRRHIDARGPGARVLEIGAGTGATTRVMLNALSGARAVEYCFTDLSPAFLRQGEESLRALVPDGVTLRYERFDAEVDPAAQGRSADHDAVVVAGVLHATSDATAALRNAARLLRPGGLLLVQETTGHSDFLTLTFGLTEGWWRHQDHSLRLPNSPLLSADSWRTVAERAGLTEVEVHDGSVGGHAGPCAIVGRAPAQEPAGTVTPEAVRHYVRTVFAEVLKHHPDDLADGAAFDEFGIDSLVSLSIIARFEADLGPLPSTLLFEHLTIAALADHLHRHQEPRLTAAIHEGADEPTPLGTETADPVAAAVPTPPRPQSAAPDDIAIIGVSGRYPGAPDLEAFWHLLASGKDAISEVPDDRFSWREHYDPRPGTANRLYTADGGFIDGVDRFDPAFFGILARDAVTIDPQERLFLETCWDLLEQTGNLGDRAVARTGVFAGAMYGTYGQLGATAWPQGELTGAHSSYWSIANRVSYLLDLSGPSYAVDSACSSSLTALHLACESLRRGECDTAIAGGVNVIIHPAHFVALCSLTMLSPHGLCKVFDAEADGFVPGEGVGAVLLKPLGRAIEDGDDIWAVVKGSAVNAGGRTSGYTVPNPNAQAAVMRQALDRAGVEPGTIGYVEAHGTGTALGDPIEIAGLRQVFDQVDPATGRVAVGSVKANVGHLEAAAGIAGLTKVLLQLRHGAIVPCAHLNEVNPRIDLGARLDLPRELRRWEAGPTLRRAGVSSFGAGGANAHVVIEEYRSPLAQQPSPVGEDHLFVLSARSPQLLTQYASDVATALAEPLPPGTGLRELAHTSQRGRPAFRERLAVLCGSVPELVTRLTGAARGDDAPGVWRDTAGPGRATSVPTQAGEWAEAARQWVGGANVDWAARWPSPPRVAAFPGHPQQRRRTWWQPAAALPTPAPAASTSHEPVAVTVRALGEAVRQHHVGGRRILPGAAVPELVHTALASALPDPSGPLRFTDLTWLRPLDLDASDEARVVPGEHGPGRSIPFTLTSTSGVVHAQGAVESLRSADLSTATAPTPEQVGPPVAPAVVYARLTAGGVHHGSGLQVLQALWAGPGECLADLAASPASGHRIDPTVLDGALQALAVLDDTTGYLPTSLAELISSRPLPARCRVHARDVTSATASDVRTVDVDVYDGDERVLALKGLRLTAVHTRTTTPAASDATTPAATPAAMPTAMPAPAPQAAEVEVRHRRPRWQPAGPAQPQREPKRVLVHCSDPALRAELAGELARRGIDWDTTTAGAPLDAVLQVCPPDEGDLNTQLREGFSTALRLATDTLTTGGPLRMLVAHHSDQHTGRPRPAYAALGSLLRTLSLEHTDYSGVHVHIDAPTVPIARLLVDELLGSTEGDVRLTAADERHTLTYEEYEPSAGPGPVGGPGRTYLITGGAGRIGVNIAGHLAANGPVNLVLSGRRQLDATVAAALTKLSATGAEVMYHPADVSDRQQVDELLRAVRRRFGTLHGIVHSAGVTRDSRAVHKSADEIADVLAPKVWGVVHLDEATRDEPLEFLALFSSVAATTGNLGQADYTFANAFLDSFAEERAALHTAGLRQGRTISIGWPLWEDGGMPVHEASRTLMEQYGGMVPLSTPHALRAFDAVMNGTETRPGLIAYTTASRQSAGTPQYAQPPTVHPDTVERGLRTIAAGFLMVADEDVDTETDLMELGFDSISLTELITQVNTRHGLDLLPTVLFETPTLRALAERLVRDHPQLGHRATVEPPPAVECTPLHPAAETLVNRPLSLAAAPDSGPRGVQQAPPVTVRETAAVVQFPGVADSGPADRTGMPVAVVGMAGRFPGADDLTALWRIVSTGADQVGPVPADRTDLAADPRMDRVRAGFVQRVADFDAAAFGISPREAGFMDPQQRHLLEVTWQALYDAGRRPSELAGSATGVFVGVATGDYNELMAAHGGTPEAHMATGVAHAVLANRVSHLLDLHGPSEALDTACSSSLVAVHHAVRALQHGDCDLAIAGGVNLTLSPALFATFERAGMLSPRGRCASFDDSADGYVRGEGTGVVVLKPLDRALADGDHVHAVVLGTAVNHSGRSPSLTAPNPQAQAQVIVDAVRKAGVDPRTIGFVQAHGTGTALGDPVEIEGLKQAYARLYEDWDLPDAVEPHIAVGSVKTNIGHLEAAAGIAGLLATVLAMQNGAIPPHPRLREPNRYLRLSGTPLYLADRAREWEPVLDEAGQPVRRAGVSSFGFGGTNAHVVLQSAGTPPAARLTRGVPMVVPVSARDERGLADYCEQLADALDRTPELDVERVAHTLQSGRDELPHRLALVVTDRTELIALLRGGSGEVQRGVVPDSVARTPLGTERYTAQEIAAAWCAGRAVDWSCLWPTAPGRVPLPGPGFTGTAHWFPRPAPPTDQAGPASTQVETDRPTTREPVRLAPVRRRTPAQSTPRPPVESTPMVLPAPPVGESSTTAPEHAVPSTPPVAVVSDVPKVVGGISAEVLRDRVAIALGLPADVIGDRDSLTRLGLDSIMRVELVRWLQASYGLTVPASELYEHDTLAELAGHVHTVTATAPEPQPSAPAPAAAPAAEPELKPEPEPELELELDREPEQSRRPDLVAVVRAAVERSAQAELGPEGRFTEGGLSSLDMLRAVRSLETTLGTLPKTLLFDHPDCPALTAHLVERFGEPAVARLADGTSVPAITRERTTDTGHEAPPSGPSALVVPRADLPDHPELLHLVQDVERRYGLESGLAGLSIAPLLFFPSTRDGYLAIGRREDSVLVWRYTGAPERFRAAAGELLVHCTRNGLRLNLLSTEPLTELGGTPMLATAFGVVQRLDDLGSFSLDGGHRSKLRYLVRRFGREGDNRVEEYTSGSHPATDAAIADLVDRWSEGKQMVNAYVAEVREQIRAGRLTDRHRIFLTHRDDRLLSAIVLTALPAENGQLLDVEFYPRDMPLGGLEYSLVEIIGRLAAEGAEVLSFGGSFGVEVAATPNPAEDVRQALAELRSVGIFDEGNYRFKKKFRPAEVPLYVCQPVSGRTDAIDLIMMIANAAETGGQTDPPQVEPEADEPEADELEAAAPGRDAFLTRAGHNPILLDHTDVETDLLTDSWFERFDPFVTDRMAALATRVADTGHTAQELPAWLPQRQVSWTTSGRAAELRLCRSWPGRRGVVLHNDLFPTWQFALAEAGLRAVRLPRSEGAAPGGDDRLAGLAALLDEHGSDVSFVCLELSTNAAGGLPLSLEALRETAALLRTRGVPLVLDATRVVDNAWAITEPGADVWQTVRDLLESADAVTLSLSKNFALATGGMVATRRADLAERLAEDEDAYGRQLGLQQQALLTAALGDTTFVGALIHRRAQQVRLLHGRLTKAGAPLHGAPGTHCLLLDPGRDPAFGDLTQPGPALLAWLYRGTGVRGGPHVGDDPAGLIRLALPLGLSDTEAEALADRLADRFGDRTDVVDLMPMQPADSPMALARARFEPVDRVPDDVRAAVAAGYERTGDNLAVLTRRAPTVRRHLVELGTATVEAFVHGDTGPTLLLMHPFNIGAGMFADQFAALGADHRLVVLHHPGVGATRTRGTMSLDHIVDLHTAALAELGIEGPFHLVGASWGSLVAQTFALRHPERAASLTTIGGSYRYANRVGEVNRLEVVVAEDLAAVAAATGDDGPRPALAADLLCCESMDAYVGLSYLDLFVGEPDLLRRLPELRLPALVIQGRLDTVVPLETARRLAGAIPDARYEELPDAGHFPCVTHADEITRLLREVIATAATAPRPTALQSTGPQFADPRTTEETS
ncbi:SDR family NAD(P)-dependent oxidoreductase [Streptomyces sp. NPDC005963]|uniref:SDR family NAD(P)-dependent oxidoreductase n=1 Tax=Streptomyces sp. NPDC005963 TaxID=3156721 RepID=UPI0033CE7269